MHPTRTHQRSNEEHPTPKRRSLSRFGANVPPTNDGDTPTDAGDDYQITVLNVDAVPMRGDLRAYVRVVVGVWAIRMEIRQHDCDRARVVFPKGRDAQGRPQTLIHCLDPRLAQAIARACLRAWLESPL